MKSELVDGELQIKDTEIVASTDLKQVLPEEITNFKSSGMKPLGIDVGIVMQVLQDRMYTNKNICFQELPCNGRDAIIRRISSGYKDFQPEVKVIFNQKDGSIRIIDNGCGMSEKVIDEVYRFYGRSDKRNTADEIGMFGLGSKSVFAVADEFVVETDAIDDQIRSRYLVTKRGIIQLSREPSTGEFGTSVTFAKNPNLNMYDVESFMKSKFSLWNLPVNIYTVSPEGETRKTRVISRENCNTEDILKEEIPECPIRFETDNYVFVSGPKISTQNIFVGQVPYEIHGFNSFIEEIFGGKFSIFIKNPNCVTISATRENIERDEKMKVLVADIEIKVREYVEKQIDEKCKDIDIKNIKNFDDIDYLWNLRISRPIFIEKYPMLYNIMENNLRCYKGKENTFSSIFKLLRRQKEEKRTLVWKKGEIRDTQTIPEYQDVIVLDKNCNVCNNNTECISCESRNLEGNCRSGFEKKHFAMTLFPEFVPQKIAKVINSNHFNAFSLKNKKRKTFDIGSSYIMDIFFTTEDFDTMIDDVFKVSEDKLKKLKTLKPSLKVVTKEEYQKKILALMRFHTKENIFNLEEMEKHKLIVHGVSTYGMDDSVQNMFSASGDLFIKEYINDEVIKHLETKGVKVIDMVKFLKMRKIKPKLKLTNIPATIVFDLIDRLKSHGMVMSQKGNVISFNDKPKKAL